MAGRTWVAATAGLALALGCSRGTADTNAQGKAAQGAEAARKEGIMLTEHRSGEWTPGMSGEEMQTLYDIAWDTLRWCVGGAAGKFDFSTYTLTPKLREDMATFVTLNMRGMLRGCIGSLAPVAPLYESVHDNAVNAALRDHRFRPVTVQELDEIDVHISILSAIVPIESPEEFRIGEHGIIVEKGAYRAVYLPEVAVEQGWTREETLGHLSEKAGMHRDGWKKGCRFRVFSSVGISKE